MDHKKKIDGVRIGKGLIYLADAFVDMLAMIVVLLLFIFGVYALWDSHIVYGEASSANYQKYKPDDQDGGLGFENFSESNKDVIAWLTVYGTHIDYPVVQGSDNMKYINTDAMGNYSMSGSLFLDCDNAPDFSDFNSIVFGHHMDRNAMFGEIASFKDKAFFDEHEYGDLYYDGRHYGVHFFSFMEVDAYDNQLYTVGITGDEKRAEYIEYIRTLASNSRSEDLTTDSRILLLSTCTNDSTNGRHILAGVIEDEIYPDAFYVEPEAGGTVINVSQIGQRVSDVVVKKLTLWLFILLLILILLWLVCEFFRRRRYNRKNKGA